MTADELEALTETTRFDHPYRAARRACTEVLNVVEPMVRSGYLVHTLEVDEWIVTIRRLRRLCRWPQFAMPRSSALETVDVMVRELRSIEAMHAAHRAEVLES